MLKYFHVLVMLFCWYICAKCIALRTADSVEDGQQTDSSGKRQKRVAPLLIFPRTAPTRIQWIIGIGIPLEDLVFEAMTTGYVIKAEYFLPYEAEQLRIKTTLNIAGRNDDGSANNTNTNNHTASDWKENLRETMQASKKVLSSYRWAVYKGLEHLAIKMGLAGRTCVLKSICESAELNLHVANGMFGELLHILLTPSSSVDELSEYADNDYFRAEYMGRSGADCNHLFKDCPQSLLDRFSDIYTFSEDLGKLTGLNDLFNAIQFKL